MPFETPPFLAEHRTVTPRFSFHLSKVFFGNAQPQMIYEKLRLSLHTALTRYDPIDEVEELF
jgi:hypothetical protein